MSSCPCVAIGPNKGLIVAPYPPQDGLGDAIGGAIMGCIKEPAACVVALGEAVLAGLNIEAAFLKDLFSFVPDCILNGEFIAHPRIFLCYTQQCTHNHPQESYSPKCSPQKLQK